MCLALVGVPWTHSSSGRLANLTREGGKPMTTLHSPMDTEVAHGLKGVVSHATQLSEVDGQGGRLVIRGYDIHELAGNVSFEEAAYLLWYGDLPSLRQLDH